MLELKLKTGSFVFLEDISIQIGQTTELDESTLSDNMLKNIAVMIFRHILDSNMTAIEVARLIKDSSKIKEIEKATSLKVLEEVALLEPSTIDPSDSAEIADTYSETLDASEDPEAPEESEAPLEDKPKDLRRKKK
jgi:hypothetical protein